MITSRELMGEEAWKKDKADYDQLMAYRKTIRGKPDIYQQAQLALNQIWIDFYNRRLFHRWVSYCDCKACADLKQETKEMKMYQKLKARYIV